MPCLAKKLTNAPVGTYLYVIATLQHCGEVKGRQRRIMEREEGERGRGRKGALVSLTPSSQNPSFATECGFSLNDLK